MLLQLTDGTTTVTLSGTAPVRGATYFPATPQRSAGGEWQDVTETAEVNMTGTAAAIRATINSVELLLLAAQRRRDTGAGERVFVLYKPVDADSTAYRSEVLDGRVVWSTNPGLRHLEWTTPTVQVAVIWTRAPWWESTTEVEATISATSQAAATGGRTVTNNPATGNWIQAAAAQITGVLPTPARLYLANNTGSSKIYRKIFVGNNVYSDPGNFAHYMQAEGRLSGGTVTANAAASGGSQLDFTLSNSTATFVWTLPAADLQRSKGRRFRLLARFSGTIGALYVKPQVRNSAGLVLWQGDELALSSLVYESWEDLGIVPLPPGGYAAGAEAMQLALVFRGSALVQLDVIQLTALDSYRHIDIAPSGVTANNGAALVVDDNEGLAYVLTGSNWQPMPVSYSAPLLLYPGVINRLYILHEINAQQTAGAGDAAIGLTLSARVFYRPRRLTV